MSITRGAAQQVIDRVMDAHDVAPVETMSADRMSALGAALRHELEQAGAELSDLAGILGNLIRNIAADPELSEDARNRSIHNLCDGFGFDVQRVPTGPERTSYELKPRMLN